MTLTIIGMGRIGRVFAKRAEEQGHEVCPITRTSGKLAKDGPILVAVGEDHLAGVTATLDLSLGPRVVFVQNGLIHQVMARFEGAGRGLLHFAADAEGAVRVLRRSVFGGDSGARLAPILSQGDIPAYHEARVDELKTEEIRKLLWSTVLSVLAAARNTPVGRLHQQHGDELDALARECIAIAAAELGVEPRVDDIVVSLKELADALPDYPGSKRGQVYRNKLLVQLGRARGLQTKRNEAILTAIGA